MSPELFEGGLLHDVLETQNARMAVEIDDYDRDRFLNTSPDDLAEYFEAKYRLEPPRIIEEGIVAEDRETQVDARYDFDRDIRPDLGDNPLVAGTSITVRVPFSGDRDLLRFMPSQRFVGGHTLRGNIADNAILLTYVTTNQNPDELRRWYAEMLRQLKQYFEWIGADVTRYNNGLRALAARRVADRRTRLLANQGLVASLGIPLAARPDAPRNYPVPDIKKKSAPAPPPAGTAPFQPEPALTDEQYEQILGLIRPMGTTMERDPAAFVSLSEENLRSLFLATLNSHYQGRATGETFNVGGKTDILIRDGDRNVFIAECKIWRGSSSLEQAIDQVLSYASWRDTKTAILLFNRNKNFSAVLEQVTATVTRQALFKQELAKHAETEFRFRFGHKDDPSRELTLTVLVFDVPAPE